MESLDILPKLKETLDYIFVDLDDTLKPSNNIYPEDYHAVHLPRFAEIVRLANSRVIPPIALCTGRELPYVLGGIFPLMNALSIIEGGVLTCNLARSTKQYHEKINAQVRQYFQNLSTVIFPQILEHIPDLYLYTGKEINIAIQCRNPHASIKDYEELLIRELEKRLGGDIKELEYDLSSIAFDFRPKGVNKGSSFDQVCRVERIDPQRVLSIGDSPGDFPIMQKVGFLGTPLNADDLCKDLVTSKGRERGKIAHYQGLQGVIEILTCFAQQECAG